MRWMSSMPNWYHTTLNVHKNANYNIYRFVGSIQQNVGSIQQNFGSTQTNFQIRWVEPLQFQCIGSIRLAELSHSIPLNTDATAPKSPHEQKL